MSFTDVKDPLLLNCTQFLMTQKNGQDGFKAFMKSIAHLPMSQQSKVMASVRKSLNGKEGQALRKQNKRWEDFYNAFYADLALAVPSALAVSEPAVSEPSSKEAQQEEINIPDSPEDKTSV